MERFLDGDTTLKEEKWLYDYFNSVERVPEEWLPYAEYFRDLAAIPSTTAEVSSPMEAEASSVEGDLLPAEEAKPTSTKDETGGKRSRGMRLWMRMAIGVAASVVLAVAGVWTYGAHEESRLAQIYGGSFVIVDGQRNDNLREIKDSIRQTLADASRIERKMEGESVVE